MTSLLLNRIVRLKQGIDGVKAANTWQKPSRAEAVIEDAVFVIEQMVNEQQRLESLISDLMNGAGKDA